MGTGTGAGAEVSRARGHVLHKLIKHVTLPLSLIKF